MISVLRHWSSISVMIPSLEITHFWVHLTSTTPPFSSTIHHGFSSDTDDFHYWVRIDGFYFHISTGFGGCGCGFGGMVIRFWGFMEFGNTHEPNRFSLPSIDTYQMTCHSQIRALFHHWLSLNRFYCRFTQLCAWSWSTTSIIAGSCENCSCYTIWLELLSHAGETMILLSGWWGVDGGWFLHFHSHISKSRRSLDLFHCVRIQTHSLVNHSVHFHHATVQLSGVSVLVGRWLVNSSFS
jgi:hypothetical protein